MSIWASDSRLVVARPLARAKSNCNCRILEGGNSIRPKLLFVPETTSVVHLSKVNESFSPPPREARTSHGLFVSGGVFEEANWICVRRGNGISSGVSEVDTLS